MAIGWLVIMMLMKAVIVATVTVANYGYDYLPKNHHEEEMLAPRQA